MIELCWLKVFCLDFFSIFSVSLPPDIDTARDLFHKTANRIFKQYDTDESGSLDRDELYDVLKQLGGWWCSLDLLLDWVVDI